MRGENKQFLKSALLAGDWQKFRNQSKRAAAAASTRHKSE
jgi:hypothetical protein